MDVEGGQATLFVTRGGQSLLVDTGWPENEGRDADRIAAAAKDARVEKLDFVLVTHFHKDHAGGITQLAARIPIGTVIDHGENREHSDTETEQVWRDYQSFLAKGSAKRVTAKAGDSLPLKDIEVKVVSSDVVSSDVVSSDVVSSDVVSSDGALISQPLRGAGGSNHNCRASHERPAESTENARSLGMVITFGKLRILGSGPLDLGQNGIARETAFTQQRQTEHLHPSQQVLPAQHPATDQELH